MRTIALVLACSACACHGNTWTIKQTQGRSGQEHRHTQQAGVGALLSHGRLVGPNRIRKHTDSRSVPNVWMGVTQRKVVPLASLETGESPQSAVGVDGGDIWKSITVSDAKIEETVKEACSQVVLSPIIAQYYPGRLWLWRQWAGTIVKRTLPREVLINTALALAICLLSCSPSVAQFTKGHLEGVAKVWTLSATIASFMLSFFLSQSYSVWRDVYSVTRRVQGRLNDISFLCATYAKRNCLTGKYTPEADALLQTVARYVRLFHMLFYASVTTRYAPLRLPKGLDALVEDGALTNEERDLLVGSSAGHIAVLNWLSMLVDRAVADGSLSATVARLAGISPIQIQLLLQNKLLELRATFASLKDMLTGRMPLAYVQLVQILMDGLLLFTPVALIHSVGPFGVLFGTAVVTLFYGSLVTLAKLFLDPLNNEPEHSGDPGISGIEVATLLQETNQNSDRWRKSASVLPEVVWRLPSSLAEKLDAASLSLNDTVMFYNHTKDDSASEDDSESDSYS